MPPLEDYETGGQAAGKIIPLSGINSPAAFRNGGWETTGNSPEINSVVDSGDVSKPLTH